ncbi:JAB domain-containing protein [Bacteroidetes bacterium endosymbiont of Geopemphigus sp.]
MKNNLVKANHSLTKEMKKLANLSQIQLFDHIIIQKSFYSFLENSVL